MSSAFWSSKTFRYYYPIRIHPSTYKGFFIECKATECVLNCLDPIQFALILCLKGHSENTVRNLPAYGPQGRNRCKTQGRVNGTLHPAYIH